MEDPYYHLIRRYPQLFQDGHILDIGANVGYTAYQFSKIVSSGYKVFAFEPDLTNFNVLRYVIEMYKMNNIVYPFQIAIGESQKQVDFWQRSNGHADHRIKTDALSNHHSIDAAKVVKINQDTVDHFTEARQINEAVKFIKIDVQGYEPSVLAGMSRIIKQSEQLSFSMEYSPQILIEMGFNVDSFINSIEEIGFKLYEIKHNGRLDRIENLKNLALPKRGYMEILFTRESF